MSYSEIADIVAGLTAPLQTDGTDNSDPRQNWNDPYDGFPANDIHGFSMADLTLSDAEYQARLIAETLDYLVFPQHPSAVVEDMRTLAVTHFNLVPVMLELLRRDYSRVPERYREIYRQAGHALKRAGNRERVRRETLALLNAEKEMTNYAE